MLRHLSLALLVCCTGAAELTVGSGKMYAKPSLAAAAASNGDTISIDAGTYSDDVCFWTKSNLTLRGVGGRAKLAVGYNVVAGGKAIWVISGSAVTVENIEFTGARIPGTGLPDGSMNAAGIRGEGTGLTIRNCYFHDNQNGILTGANASSDILIENSEFAYNGASDGYTHNLYIGAVRSLTFRYNYSHHAKVGQNLKSRALANYIIANRIMDEASGTSSYVVDLPNGGLSFLLGNLIQQGPLSSNRSVIINYGAEGLSNPSKNIYVCSNTIVNDYTGAGGTNFLNLAAGTAVARVENNIFLGQGTAIAGPVTSNLHNLVTSTSPLVNRAAYDFHLLASASTAIDDAVNPGTYEGQALLPTRQYVHPCSSQVRSTSGAAPDIGAYEYAGTNAAPVISEGTSTTLAVNEDTAGAKTLNATDADGDAITWSIMTPAGKGTATASGTGASKSVGYTPSANQNGSDSFVVQVSDGKGGTDTITVNVTIAAVNDAPVLATPIPDRSATAGTAFSYTVPLATFTDVDSTLTWSSNEALGWLSFNATTRMFSGTPAIGDVGSTTITVTASDGSLSASDSFVLVVTATNTAPTISAATATPASVTGKTSAVAASASDDGGEANLIYTWSATGPAAVAFSVNGTNAAKAATATFARAGSYVLTVTARDLPGLTAIRTVNVTVAATPTALVASPASVSVAAGGTAAFAAVAYDQFGIALSPQPAVGWAIAGGGTISAGGLFTAGAAAGGPWTVTATAGALSDTSQVSVTVTPAPAPTASSGGGGGGCGAGMAGLLLALACLPLRRRRR